MNNQLIINGKTVLFLSDIDNMGNDLLIMVLL